jgi:ribosomal-protein-alanine N-acetyltransferase
MIAETDRLYLREMTPADAESAYELNLDPEVVQYTGDVAFKSVEDARTFLSNYDHYKKYGFGRWAVIQKSNHEFLGWCGLKYHEDTKEFDLGYRFFKMHWGKGFATEASKACLELGFTKFNMPEIYAEAMKANPASIKVMEKVGMHLFKESICGGEPAVYYKIVNPQL